MKQLQELLDNISNQLQCCARNVANDMRNPKHTHFFRTLLTSGVGPSEKADGQKRTTQRRSRRARRSTLFCSMTMASDLSSMHSSVNFTGRGLTRKRSVQLLADVAEAQQGKAEAATADDEPILISEVAVAGVQGELKERVNETITLKPNFTYTQADVAADMQRLIDTGWFENVRVAAADTRDGVRVTYEVTPNPEVKGVRVEGGSKVPQSLVENAFRKQYGKTMNYNHLRKAIDSINEWYEEQGYMGQVHDMNMADNGTVVLKLCEGVVDSVSLKFIDKKTGDAKDEGETRPETILRYITTKPGQVYNLRQIQSDLETLYSLGIFDDVAVAPVFNDDKENLKVQLRVEVKEKKSRGLSGGIGVSTLAQEMGSKPGAIANFAYHARNLFGLNQELKASVEFGQQDRMFRLVHSDPWPNTNRHRVSRTVTLQNTRSTGESLFAIDRARVAEEGEGEDTGAENVSNIARLMGTAEWSRPLTSNWTVNWGGGFMRAQGLNEVGRPLSKDYFDSPITFSGGTDDWMVLTQGRAVYRDNDQELTVSIDKAWPVYKDWLNFLRIQGRCEKQFSLVGPLTLSLGLKGGAVIGDLPPHQAFAVGGTNSVRGYSDGGVATARQYAVGTAELRWPLLGPLQGVLFADAGTDFESGASVIGDPAGSRGKPGHGYGYGAGLRVNSPVGPLRFEYAVNKQQASRFHVGIGYYG